MKKNFTVNIGNKIFNVDEDAYDKLKDYLESLMLYFRENEAVNEILSDIEHKIAEMLSEKLSEEKNIITINDILEVIAKLGSPDKSKENESQNVNNKTNKRKRLYRDYDNRILGGVCGGLAAFFGIESMWVRFAFILAFFVFGIGPFIYIILWMTIPVAKTTVEKLEMRGEPINITSIEKNIIEEFQAIKNKFNETEKDLPLRYTKKIAAALEKIAKVLYKLIFYVARFIGILIGIVFVMVSIFLIIGFLGTLFSYNQHFFIATENIIGFSIPLMFNNFFESSAQITLAIIGISLFVGVPLIMLMYNGIKLIFGLKVKTVIVGLSAFSLWLAGTVICGIMALQLMNDIAYKITITKKYNFKIHRKEIYFVASKDKGIDTLFTDYQLIGKWNMISSDKKEILFGIPDFEMQPSDNDSIKIIIYSSARGKNKSLAYNRADKVIYNFTCNDTALIFDPYYRLPLNAKWRGHNLKVIVKIPTNKQIIFDKSMKNILFNGSNFEKFQNMDLITEKWLVTNSGIISQSKKDTINN